MTEQSKQKLDDIDETQISKTMTDIAERSQRLVQDFLSKNAQPGNASVGMDDPMNIGNAFMEMTTKMMTNPHKMVEANMNLWQDYMKLWQNTASRMMGQEQEPIVEPEHDDRRFKGEAWESDVFDFIKQSYQIYLDQKLILKLYILYSINLEFFFARKRAYISELRIMRCANGNIFTQNSGVAIPIQFTFGKTF